MEASVWRFVAREGAEGQFEALYGPSGAWAQFFQRSPEYRGSFLLRDQKHARGYIVIDVWHSRDAHKRYCDTHWAMYSELDKQGGVLTESETHEGWFEDVQDVLRRLD